MIAVGQRVKLVSRAEIDAAGHHLIALNPGLWETHYYDVPEIGALGTVRNVCPDGLFEVAFDNKCCVMCDVAMVISWPNGIERVQGGADWGD